MYQPIFRIWKKQISIVIVHSANCLKTDDDQPCHSKGGEKTCIVCIKCLLCGITLTWVTMTTELQVVSSAKKENHLFSVSSRCKSYLSLKVQEPKCLELNVALVLKSPAREPGRFSSSWIRWAIRACNLTDKKKNRQTSNVGETS